jgi:hypothetical protein
MVEVQAGSDQDHPGEEVRPHIENCCQNRNPGFPNSPCKTHHRIGRQFGKIRPEMRSERGKAHGTTSRQTPRTTGLSPLRQALSYSTSHPLPLRSGSGGSTSRTCGLLSRLSPGLFSPCGPRWDWMNTATVLPLSNTSSRPRLDSPRFVTLPTPSRCRESPSVKVRFGGWLVRSVKN